MGESASSSAIARSSRSSGAPETRPRPPETKADRTPVHGALLGDVEPEVADLAVADDVVLALEALLAPGPEIGERSLDRHQIVVARDLGADEAPLDVRVHRAGGGLRPRARGDRPRAHLVLTHRKEGDEPEQRIAVAQHAMDRRLLQPQIGQEGPLL